MKVMNLGDILYVIKPYKTTDDQNHFITTDYHFIPGHMYQITYILSGAVSGVGVDGIADFYITNITTGDGILHFLPGIKHDEQSMICSFVTSDEWRELQLRKLGI